jgi:hypothetical protein
MKHLWLPGLKRVAATAVNVPISVLNWVWNIVTDTVKWIWVWAKDILYNWLIKWEMAPVRVRF